MPVGHLIDRIDLEYPTVTRDAYGSQSTTWTKKATVWAEVHYVKQSQQLDSDRVMTEGEITIKTHYRTDVSEAWRVKWRGKYYAIRTVDNTDRRRRWLDLRAVQNEAF